MRENSQESVEKDVRLVLPDITISYIVIITKQGGELL